MSKFPEECGDKMPYGTAVCVCVSEGCPRWPDLSHWTVGATAQYSTRREREFCQALHTVKT